MALYWKICLLLLPMLLPMQDGPATMPRFEVASIKLVDPKASFRMVGVKVYPGGKVVLSGLTLHSLVVAAFHLSHWQISGGDAWTKTDEFNIEVKAPDNALAGIKDLHYTNGNIDDERLCEMLQSLLADRFELRFHRGSKPGNVYLLKRIGKSLKLHVSENSSGDEVSSFGSIGYAEGKWVISDTTMPQLAKFASDYILRAPVLDRTDLSGFFDYRQRVSDLEPNYRDNSASFLSQISEAGLMLERSKGIVETFVIDHAVKPSPN